MLVQQFPKHNVHIHFMSGKKNKLWIGQLVYHGCKNIPCIRWWWYTKCSKQLSHLVHWAEYLHSSQCDLTLAELLLSWSLF